MLKNNKEKIGPVVLLIVDGWGIAPDGEGNALTKANMPNFKELVSKYPSTTLETVFRKGPLRKKINIAENYFSIGTGKIKLTQGNQSIFDVLNNAKKNWLVITEAEKLAYCTYFFAAQKKIKKDNYLLVSSKTKGDRSLEPGMSSPAITEVLLKKIKSRKYDFIFANFANLDIVAHNGNFAATVKAAEIIDQLLKSIIKTVKDLGGVLLLTSSNGNAEDAIEMVTETNNVKDTNNPVPLIIVGRQFEGKTFGFKEAPSSDLALVSPGGILPDIMPTILKIMGIEIPDDLDGKALI